jgi:hypothetical protein
MVVRASQNPSNYQKKSGNLSENPENRKKSLGEGEAVIIVNYQRR